MRLLLKNAHLYRHQAFSDTDVLIEDGIIKKIGAVSYTHLTLPTTSRV